MDGIRSTACTFKSRALPFLKNRLYNKHYVNQWGPTVSLIKLTFLVFPEWVSCLSEQSLNYLPNSLHHGIRPVTQINTEEVCPVCHGTGKISPSIVIDEEIERKIAFYTNEKNIRSFILKTGPVLGAYISRGFNSFLRKWKRKYKCKIRHEEVLDFSVLQNEIYTDSGERLDSQFPHGNLMKAGRAQCPACFFVFSPERFSVP